MDLKLLCKRIADRLGIDPLEIKFEKMFDDSRLYLKEEYIAYVHPSGKHFIRFTNKL